MQPRGICRCSRGGASCPCSLRWDYLIPSRSRCPPVSDIERAKKGGAYRAYDPEHDGGHERKSNQVPVAHEACDDLQRAQRAGVFPVGVCNEFSE